MACESNSTTSVPTSQFCKLRRLDLVIRRPDPNEVEDRTHARWMIGRTGLTSYMTDGPGTVALDSSMASLSSAFWETEGPMFLEEHYPLHKVQVGWC